jgi:hypothetical protein
MTRRTSRFARQEQQENKIIEKKFVIVVADDWEAIYFDGKCIAQDHEIRRDYLLRYMRDYGVNAANVEEIEAYNDPHLESGRFPDKLEEVTKD